MVAALGWSIAAPTFARRRLPETDFFYLVDRCSNMDSAALEQVAELCGADARPVFRSAAFFDAALREILERHRLEGYFREYPQEALHKAIRPRGFDFNPPGYDELPDELAAWRRSYADEPQARQILIATILCLYSNDMSEDNPWLKDLPHQWNAVDGILSLKAADLLADWVSLIVSFDGW